MIKFEETYKNYDIYLRWNKKQTAAHFYICRVDEFCMGENILHTSGIIFAQEYKVLYDARRYIDNMPKQFSKEEKETFILDWFNN
jgi:hypothetical protein